MKQLRSVTCLLLCLAMLLPVSACSGGSGYRIIDEYSEEGSYYIGFRKGDNIQNYVIAAMQELAANNTLRAASINWFGDNIVNVHGQSGALEEVYDTLLPRSVIIGVDYTNKPMSFEATEGAGPQGFDIDMISYICSALGWDMVFRPINIDEADVELNSGNIDIAMAIPGSDLTRDLDYSPAYLESQYVLVTRSGSHIRRRGGLKGKTLGVAVSDVDVLQQNQKFVDSLGGVTYQTNTDGLFQALMKGEVDGILVTSVVAAYYMK